MYRSYRGRRRFGCLIPTLVILCVIAAGTLFFLRRHISFTVDGMTLTLPFSGREVPLGGEKPVPLIIENPAAPPPAASLPAPDISETPEEPEKERERALFVPFDTVVDEEAFAKLLSRVTGSQFNTLILELKAADGKLAFASETKLAASSGASFKSNIPVKNALTKIKQKNLRAVAALACFKDNLTARKVQSAAARTKNRVIWLDGTNTTWLSAHSKDAREYLAELVSEVGALGFSDILLSDVSFPDFGKTGLLYYPQETELGETKRDAVLKFIKALPKAEGELTYRVLFDPKDPEKDSGASLRDFTDEFSVIYAFVKGAKDSVFLDPDPIEAMKDELGDEFPSRFIPIIKQSEAKNIYKLWDYIYLATTEGNGSAIYDPKGDYDDGLFIYKTVKPD